MDMRRSSLTTAASAEETETIQRFRKEGRTQRKSDCRKKNGQRRQKRTKGRRDQRNEEQRKRKAEARTSSAHTHSQNTFRSYLLYYQSVLMGPQTQTTAVIAFHGDAAS